MDSYSIDKLKHVANTEVIRRLLIKYFVAKGYSDPGSFNRHVCPTVIQDLPYMIPILGNKIEIIPYTEEIDTMSNRAILGWNLFALGNYRMFLGETHHVDLQSLARDIQSGILQNANARKETTPKQIVTFVTRVLGDHKAGYVPLVTPTMQPQRVFAPKGQLMNADQRYNGVR